MELKKIAAIATAGVLVLSGCSGGGGSGAAAPYATDGVFTYGLDADPGTLSPFMTTSDAAREITPFLYDNLVYFDGETGEPKSWLAESWEVTPTSVKYTLKDGVTCQDGSKLTPEIVANNFNWITDPQNKSAINGVLVPPDATAEFDDQAGTVTVSVKEPTSFLLTQTGALEILCQSALDDPDSVAKASNGTGMYELTEAVPNDHYTLTRRDGYTWAPEGGNSSTTEGAPKEVVVRVVENVSTSANLLLSGELNAATVKGPDEDRVAEKTTAERTLSLIIGQFYFSQLKDKPTADQRVRVALTKALDLDALTKVITAGKGYRAERLATMRPNPCEYDATKDAVPAHDVDAAKALLDDAGWTVGSNGVREKDGKSLDLTLLYSEDSDAKSAAMELVKQQLKEIGVNIKLDGGDSNYLLDHLYTKENLGSFDLASSTVNAWLPSIMIPWNTGDLPPGGRNAGGIDNKVYNAKIAEAGKIAGEASCDTWQAAEQALYEKADTIPYAAQDQVTYFNGAELALKNHIGGISVRVRE
ncbi:ABC transporter substrate-binding protein [Saxibacter everestensis]|uniref:ABC transporter substrate-binding protein n=1 Tax=Saxibacter everestensis TaxID=2909229 RepID=A0ABY8QRP8_9MICO|nr:ABC transporter substrate-binding protein [Brevibacteriaceae bacterium ZFBP1038]